MSISNASVDAVMLIKTPLSKIGEIRPLKSLRGCTRFAPARCDFEFGLPYILLFEHGNAIHSIRLAMFWVCASLDQCLDGILVPLHLLIKSGSIPLSLHLPS